MKTIPVPIPQARAFAVLCRRRGSRGFAQPALLAVLLLFATSAAAQLEWRFSVKLIASGAGSPPPNAASNVSNDVAVANQLLSTYGRGYQFRITEMLTLTGVSQWYAVDARQNTNKLALQAAARANPTLYAYRTTAINLYINNSFTGPSGFSSGVCSFPTSGDDIILAGAAPYRSLILHESGHFFSLLHTHQGESFLNANGTACSTNDCTCAQWRAGEADNTLETAADHECYTTLNQIALGAYGLPFANLNVVRQGYTTNTLQNIMSYHAFANLNILTSTQLDFMTDASNGARFNVATGKTRFVDRTNNGTKNGSSTNPWKTVTMGITNAIPGDIVLIRPGNYNELITISKPVTLRATRGSATIGAP